jgi:DNA-binding CsgD family transcriptional regulator
MYSLNNHEYEDILNLTYYCVSCLKNGGKTENILNEMLRAFKADEAVFLSANDDYEGVNLAKCYAICHDRSYLIQYAEHFWRYDPLFKMQFRPLSINPVFKTDDVIPFSQMVKLEYYYSFLRPQNLLAEMIIRLHSKDNLLGAISLQRYKEHPNFEKRDVFKASLLVPYLVNVFEAANGFRRINDERMLLEQWMESHSEGIILLDSEYKPIYINSKARFFCQLLKGVSERIPFSGTGTDIMIPQMIVKECKNLVLMNEPGVSRQNHGNRIISINQQKRYYLQYFPVILHPAERNVPYFVIFLSEIAKFGEGTEDSLVEQKKLSQREEVIVRYASLGLTNKQIAERLYISPFTVQNHLKNIFEKTGCDNRTQLANLVKYSENLPS